jgi:hypothetical protein
VTKSRGLRRRGSASNPPPHWNRDWLHQKYIVEKKSTCEIAAEVGCTDNNIHFWMQKHGIPTRSVSEARRVKHWGCSGEKNPMFGRSGTRNPRWKGGLTPLRQALYSSIHWKKVSNVVRKRDRACRLCGATSVLLELHHIIPFSKAPLFVFEERNLICLCSPCHKKVERHGSWRWRRKLAALVDSSYHGDSPEGSVAA